MSLQLLHASEISSITIELVCYLLKANAYENCEYDLERGVCKIAEVATTSSPQVLELLELFSESVLNSASINNIPQDYIVRKLGSRSKDYGMEKSLLAYHVLYFRKICHNRSISNSFWYYEDSVLEFLQIRDLLIYTKNHCSLIYASLASFIANQSPLYFDVISVMLDLEFRSQVNHRNKLFLRASSDMKIVDTLNLFLFNSSQNYEIIELLEVILENPTDKSLVLFRTCWMLLYSRNPLLATLKILDSLQKNEPALESNFLGLLMDPPRLFQFCHILTSHSELTSILLQIVHFASSKFKVDLVTKISKSGLKNASADPGPSVLIFDSLIVQELLHLSKNDNNSMITLS